jgi:hypothetical protein
VQTIKSPRVSEALEEAVAVACPDQACGAPAEVLDRWTWGSTDGPVEFMRTRCARGHVYTPMLS